MNEPVVHGLSIVAGELAGFRDDDWKPTVSTSTAAPATTCAECGAAVESTRKNATGTVEFAEPCGHRVGEPAEPRSAITVQALAQAALEAERKWARSGGRPFLLLTMRGTGHPRRIEIAPGLTGKNYGPAKQAGHTSVRVFCDDVRRWVKRARVER